MGGLRRAAALGGVRQRAWSVLLVAAFAVPAAACAAAPMFAEASGNAAFQARRDAVPVTARQDDAPVVRLSADTGSKSLDQASVLSDLSAVPGLSPPDLTGGSIGAEMLRGVFWESRIGAERGRLFAVGSPRDELVPVGDVAGTGGVWLPEPLAEEVRARPGDQVVLTVGAGIRGKRKQARLTVDGIYAVEPDGRLPADRPGRRTWALRHGDTPGDTEYRTLPAYLVIGDIATVEAVAGKVGDQLLWTAEATLRPDATLAEARRAAAGVEQVRRNYASTRALVEEDDPLSLRFASGIGRIAATADATNAAVRQRTRPVELAAIIAGLASVLAVAVLTLRRRDRELRHAVAVGMSPVSVGGLWLLEHLLPAALGGVLGWAIAWQLVVRFGPPGTLTESLAPSALAAGLAALGGLVTVAGASTLRAMRLVRAAPPVMPRRSLPWGLMIVVAALVAAAGLAGGGVDAAGGVDLLVPLLVLTAAGVAAGWLPGLLARGSTAGRPRSVVLWLARRRLGAGGAERRLAVLVVTAGLGMLMFALSALRATEVSADDRIAVASGAEAVAKLAGSYELDPAAVARPRPLPDGRMPKGPIPGVRTPPLPPGNTLVWRTGLSTPLDGSMRDVLLVDPAQFREVASWGNGAELARARAALSKLDKLAAEGPIPVLAVNDPNAAGLDSLQAEIGLDRFDLTVAEHLPAFPGMAGRPLYVASAPAVFARAGWTDPRLKPSSGSDSTGLFTQTYLWSSAGADGVAAVTAPLTVVPERVETAAELRQGDAYVAGDRARGYQVAVAGYLAALAVLTLCVYAQRTAAARRPADLMLARVGVGRGRVLQARAAEFVLLAGVAVAAAVAGVAALFPLGARLLDDQPALPPSFEFRLTPAALLVTAGVAVVATALAVLLTVVRRPGSEEDAYRDD